MTEESGFGRTQERPSPSIEAGSATPSEVARAVAKLATEIADVLPIMERAVATGHAQGLVYDSAMPCMRSVLSLAPVIQNQLAELRAIKGDHPGDAINMVATAAVWWMRRAEASEAAQRSSDILKGAEG